MDRWERDRLRSQSTAGQKSVQLLPIIAGKQAPASNAPGRANLAA